MKNQVKDLNTREKILQTALRLFNEKGVRNVTTAQIAKSLQISEGNLWYHFRTKHNLVAELFKQLEIEIDANLSRVPAENADLQDHLRYAARSFEYMWEYRFLFQERFESVLSDDFDAQIQQIIVRGQKNVERILRQMTECELLVITSAESHALAINAWIIHSSWVGYLQARDNIKQITKSHIKEGFAQMMALFNPYWSAAARIEAEKLLAEFSPSHDEEF